MAKVNEFETAQFKYEDNIKFSDEANIHYRCESEEEILKESKLKEIIQHHKTHQVPRLVALRNYYTGNNEAILTGKRRKEDHLADNRATHNFAKYVSQFIQGYMMGVPLKTSHTDKSIEERIKEINRDNDADEHNSDLVLDQSIFGRAYELIYRNNEDVTRFTTLDVVDAFVIYDDTVDCDPLAAVRYVDKQFEDKTKVFLYTSSKIIEYEMDESYALREINEKDHYFDGVPIVEYQNNKYRQGDFENALSLIDLYDKAQSDTANYMQDLNDATLVIKGNLDIDVDEAQKQKKANLLFLQTETNADGKEGQADAFYIYKEYDVAGTEAYKDRLFNNILLFTSIPNLLDEKGSTAQSGEALKMKLFALTQIRAIKERLFKKSLRDRYRLISNISNVASEGSFDVNDITVTFTENLPAMIDRELEWFNSAGGRISNKTLLENLSFVENADEEIERLDEENELHGDIFDFTDDVEVTEKEPDDLQALNGAQITSVLRVLEEVKNGMLTNEQALSILIDGLQIPEEAARKIVFK